VRRTWAPQGQTPSHSRWDRHDRLSVTSASTLSPVRQGIGLYFSIASSHSTGADVWALVQQLRGHRKRPLLLICARCSGPKKAARLLRALYGMRSHGACLPAYAPELNVVEQGWGHIKYGERANFLPKAVTDLAHTVATSLIAKHKRPALLRAFFQHAQLRL
jgi:hypothetical protein